MTKIKMFVIGITLFLIVPSGAAYLFLRSWSSSPNSPIGQQKVVFYEVKGGESPMFIARELERVGVVSNARLFYWYARLTDGARKIKLGDYRFTTAMRPRDVLTVITSGISYGLPLTVPEGYNMPQIAELVEQLKPGSGPKFLALCSDRKFIASLWNSIGMKSPPFSLEGYLFPDTYLIGRKNNEQEIIRAMVRKYNSVFTPELEARARELGMTEHQVVTLASIVEKETGAKEERPLIASVFHNRLKKRMRLQSDPTVIYGVKGYAGNITRKHLEAHTPYNTYTIPGLPIGPIANPGADALKAVLYPAESAYLYFVSHNDGTHEFTSTYEDHRKAVVRFQIDAKAREGKSWRDLGKKSEASGAVPRAVH